jgi:hypothetical protein
VSLEASRQLDHSFIFAIIVWWPTRGTSLMETERSGNWKLWTCRKWQWPTLRARAHRGNWQPQRNRNFREMLSAWVEHTLLNGAAQIEETGLRLPVSWCALGLKQSTNWPELGFSRGIHRQIWIHVLYLCPYFLKFLLYVRLVVVILESCQTSSTPVEYVPVPQFLERWT